MRRLSNGANYLGAFVDEADNELDMVSVTPQSRRTSASCRRRSTFSVRIAADSTKNQPKSTAEQNRIAEMYKVVIKMSAQNVNYLLYKDIPLHLRAQLLLLTTEN